MTIKFYLISYLSPFFIRTFLRKMKRQIQNYISLPADNTQNVVLFVSNLLGQLPKLQY